MNDATEAVKVRTAHDAYSIIAEILGEYQRKDADKSLQQWVADTVTSRLTAEKCEAERWASDLIQYLDQCRSLHADICQHRKQGESRGSWIVDQIESLALQLDVEPVSIVHLTAVLSGKTPQFVQEMLSFGWNESSSIRLGDLLAKQDFELAAQAVMEEGLQNFAAAAAGSLLGEHSKVREVAQAFIEGTLDADAETGIRAALATAVRLAVDHGLIGQDIKSAMDAGEIMPAWFGHHTFVGTAHAKLLYRVAVGDIEPDEALDQMADVLAVAVAQSTKEVGRRVGGEFLANTVTAIPLVGAFLTPVGRRVGEFLGAAVGELAGGVVGTVIKEGVEFVRTTVRSTVSSISNYVKSGLNSLGNFLFS